MRQDLRTSEGHSAPPGCAEGAFEARAGVPHVAVFVSKISKRARVIADQSVEVRALRKRHGPGRILANFEKVTVRVKLDIVVSSSQMHLSEGVGITGDRPAADDGATTGGDVLEVHAGDVVLFAMDVDCPRSAALHRAAHD